MRSDNDFPSIVGTSNNFFLSSFVQFGCNSDTSTEWLSSLEHNFLPRKLFRIQNTSFEGILHLVSFIKITLFGSYSGHCLGQLWSKTGMNYILIFRLLLPAPAIRSDATFTSKSLRIFYIFLCNFEISETIFLMSFIWKKVK